MNEEKIKWLKLQDDWEFVFIIAQFIFEQNKNFASANISRTLDCRYNELDSHEIFYYNQDNFSMYSLNSLKFLVQPQFFEETVQESI